MGLRYIYYICQNKTEQDISTDSSVNASLVSIEDGSERPSSAVSSTESSKRFGYVNEEL